MSRELFETECRGSYQTLLYRPWRANQRTHGFIGKAADFSSARCRDEWPAFSRAFAVTRLVLMRQVHGDVVREYSARELVQLPEGVSESCEADALLVRASEGSASKGSASKGSGTTAIGVRTADCVPVLAVAGEWVAIIHAGWRGLAAGICEKVFALLLERTREPCTAIIGPCAGACDYEVGPEVIEALGREAVCTPRGASPGSGPSGDCAFAEPRYLLDLPGTVVRRVKQRWPQIEIHQCGLTTISLPHASADGVHNQTPSVQGGGEECSSMEPERDASLGHVDPHILAMRWHSHRRDGSRSGRNLAFLCA